MQLVFVPLLLLLLVSTGWSMDPQKDITCHTGADGRSGDRKNGLRDHGDKKCNLCEFYVYNDGYDVFWHLRCDKTNKAAEECSRNDEDKKITCTCKCDYDHCFTKEMAEEALGKHKEAKKKWDEGERTVQGLFNVTAPKRIPKPTTEEPKAKSTTNEPPVSYSHGGFLAFSTMSFLLAIATFLFA